MKALRNLAAITHGSLAYHQHEMQQGFLGKTRGVTRQEKMAFNQSRE